MKSLARTCSLLALGALLLIPASVPAKSLGWNADALALELQASSRHPPSPQDVSELAFAELFQMPVGPEGLTPTEKLKALNGRRVRMVGFMVKQTRPAPGIALLTPYAMNTHEGEYGLCDDLPANTVFVVVPKYADLAVPFTPGPLLLTGVLEFGPRQESDGRISHLRLTLGSESTDAASES